MLIRNLNIEDKKIELRKYLESVRFGSDLRYRPDFIDNFIENINDQFLENLLYISNQSKFEFVYRKENGSYVNKNFECNLRPQDNYFDENKFYIFHNIISNHMYVVELTEEEANKYFEGHVYKKRIKERNKNIDVVFKK